MCIYVSKIKKEYVLKFFKLSFSINKQQQIYIINFFKYKLDKYSFVNLHIKVLPLTYIHNIIPIYSISNLR